MKLGKGSNERNFVLLYSEVLRFCSFIPFLQIEPVFKCTNLKRNAPVTKSIQTTNKQDPFPLFLGSFTPPSYLHFFSFNFFFSQFFIQFLPTTPSASATGEPVKYKVVRYNDAQLVLRSINCLTQQAI